METKKRRSRKLEKVGNWTMQEIRKRRKSEKVGTQKSRKSEKKRKQIN